MMRKAWSGRLIGAPDYRVEGKKKGPATTLDRPRSFRDDLRKRGGRYWV